MRAEPSTRLAQSGEIGWRRKNRQRDDVVLVADVPYPVAFRPVLAVRCGRLFGLDQQVAGRDRDQGVCKAASDRLPRPVRDQLWMGFVADVEDHQAAIDPADIDAIWSFG